MRNRAAPLITVVAAASLSLAAPPAARDQQLVTEAMNVTFAACNREDIEALMKSCADAMPDREKFCNETLATFEGKDIHSSLVERSLGGSRFLGMISLEGGGFGLPW